MREIPLSQGKIALVDDGDYEALSQHKWTADFTGKVWYAIRSVKKNGKWTHVRMHQVILPNCERVDHKNGDGLDNQRSNLRPATHRQNLINSRKRNVTSGFRGVDKPTIRWRARIVVNGVRHHLGMFDSKEAAGRAFDEANLKFNGEFARLNFQ